MAKKAGDTPLSLGPAGDVPGRFDKRRIGRDETKSCSVGGRVIRELLCQFENPLPSARVPYAEKCLDETQFLASPQLASNIVVHGHVALRGRRSVGMMTVARPVRRTRLDAPATAGPTPQ